MLFRGGFDVCRQRSNSLPGDKSTEITPTCPQICIRPDTTIEKAWELEDRESLSHLKTISSSWSSLRLAGCRPRAIGKTYIRPRNIAHFDSRENTTPLNQRPPRKCSSPRPETRTWITQRWAGEHDLVRPTKAASCRLPSRSSYHASNYQPTCERRRSPLSVP